MELCCTVPAWSISTGGVTEIVGEPREEFEKGVEHDHCSCGDSSEEFTMSNYGVTTTPHTEFNLVVSGGEGLLRRMVTRGAPQTFDDSLFLETPHNLWNSNFVRSKDWHMLRLLQL